MNLTVLVQRVCSAPSPTAGEGVFLAVAKRFNAEGAEMMNAESAELIDAQIP